MSLEICPFCEKPFKRLKSHLPHCKMSPGSKTGKITNKTKQTQATMFNPSSNKDKTNINTDTKLKCPTFLANSKSPMKSNSKKVTEVHVQKEFVQNNFTFASTASGVPTREGMSTDTLKPKTKWLGKREQEMLRQTKLQTQTKIVFTKNKMYKSQIKDAPLLEKEIASGQKKLPEINLTSELTTSRINCSALENILSPIDGQTLQSMKKCKANANISEQKDSPRPFTTEYTLGSRVKEQGVSVFQTKTCVWDHIKHGLNKRRHNSVPVSISRISAHNVSSTECVNTSESVLKHHTGNDQNASLKNSLVQFPIFQTSVQRPVVDMLSSRVQNVSVMAYSPEMATGYSGTFFFSSHSEMSSNGYVLMKCQTSRPLPQSQGLLTELSLGDVRLNELASWLGVHTPKSPRKAVTMLNKGWQWYYRKYIDVQKGGIGGIAMLIGSYCVLSYIWSYPDIKKHRWRKYH